MILSFVAAPTAHVASLHRQLASIVGVCNLLSSITPTADCGTRTPVAQSYRWLRVPGSSLSRGPCRGSISPRRSRTSRGSSGSPEPTAPNRHCATKEASGRGSAAECKESGTGVQGSDEFLARDTCSQINQNTTTGVTFQVTSTLPHPQPWHPLWSPMRHSRTGRAGNPPRRQRRW
jgi:hypothetical protein